MSNLFWGKCCRATAGYFLMGILIFTATADLLGVEKAGTALSSTPTPNFELKTNEWVPIQKSGGRHLGV